MGRGKVKYLVVDSGAFIKNAPIHELGELIYTVEGAVNEIKDKPTRQRLQVLPYELKVQEPSPEDLKYVTEFSKKTGDYPTLSAVDIRIIALTYKLEREFLGIDHLNKEPTAGKTTGNPIEVSTLAGFYSPDEEDVVECASSDEDSECRSSDDDSESPNSNLHLSESPNDSKQNESLKEEEKPCSDECDSSEQDEGTDSKYDEFWITPDNIDQMRKQMGELGLSDIETPINVACVTTDFAIQNVLLQMGLSVLSVDGMLIKETRVFILRCFACFKTTHDMTRQFCPSCGNKCLKRVAVTVNQDGEKSIHINFKRPINIRGTKYSLPLPRGGKHSNNPILCADQPVPQDRPSKAALRKVNALDPDYIAGNSPFAVNDVYSRAAHLGIRGLKAGRNLPRNPNVSCKRNKKKK